MNLPGHKPQLYPADYVRALFLTDLFSSKVKIVESWPAKSNRDSEALYVVLEKAKVEDAQKSLKALADAHAKPDPVGPAGPRFSL
jgi:hypothetical protein